MASSKVAKDRLKLVVSQDRIECSPDLVEMIKSDIIDIISKYIEVDGENVTIDILKPRCNTNSLDNPLLVTSIPITDVKVHQKEES